MGNWAASGTLDTLPGAAAPSLSGPANKVKAHMSGMFQVHGAPVGEKPRVAAICVGKTLYLIFRQVLA